VALLARTVAVALVMASFGCSAILAAEPSAAVSPPAITSATTLSPDFESLRVKGLNIALPGPQDTIDPDFAGIRSSLAALGIGYIGYTNNNFFDNALQAERTTFGRQVYNGQKPTFFTNNVMQLTYDLSRYGIPDGQIVLGGIWPGAIFADDVRTGASFQLRLVSVPLSETASMGCWPPLSIFPSASALKSTKAC
jgi:hypothetical protein